METILFTFCTNLIYEISKFGSWLTTNLSVINMSPLAILSFSGITFLIGIHITRLIIGG